MEYHGVKTNFVEYNNICFRIITFLEWIDVPLRWETLPRNSTLNILVILNTKGCSRLYSKVKDSNTYVLDIIVEKWRNNSDIEIEVSVSRSFSRHHGK